VNGRLRLALTVLVGVAALVSLLVFGLAEKHAPAGGVRAPKLPAEQLAGRPVTLGGLLAGAGKRPVLVVFWASWCGPCHEEAAAIERFSQSTVGRGRIVAVDWSDARSNAGAFVRRYGWTFPVLRDAEGLVGNDYGLTGLPTTFVISAKGRIAATLRGAQTEASLTRALGS
jgi:cytochrome c biogenesis protein CcmG, thiol:disulfide interchange protein DsbE